MITGHAVGSKTVFSLSLLTSLLCASTGCSLMYDTGEVQCESDADCASRGFTDATCVKNVCQPATGSSEWGCLGSVQWPSEGGGSDKVTLSVMVIDVITEAPPTDLEVRLCPKLDVECTNPSDSGLTFNEQGMAEVKVNPGFDGYLEMTSPTITPSLFFVTKPVWEDTVVPGVLPVVSPQGFDGIAQAIGTTLDPEMGHTFVMASSCLAQPAAGVRFEVGKENAKTARYYMINNAPVASETSTDAAGNGGFLNLDTGFVTITGYVASTGALIGESSFIVRAGAVSYPRILPTP